MTTQQHASGEIVMGTITVGDARLAAIMTDARTAFIVACSAIERDVRLNDLTDDEIDHIIAAVQRSVLDNPPRHKFWGTGEPDCPREIKAGNGELHTLRCKVCGIDDPRDERCFGIASVSA